MFKNAVREYSGPSAGKPLQSRLSAMNTAKPPDSNKRKFDRTMSNSSSLGALHQAVIFDENDFDDDDVIDLSGPTPLSKPPDPINNLSLPSSKPQKHSSSFPSVHSAAERSRPPPSSAPVPWSSSPPEHHQPPAKRRTLPWSNAESQSASTPLPKPTKGSPYPWNKTASAMKEEQKELRRRHKARLRTTKDPENARKRPSSSHKKVSSLFLSDEQKGVLQAVIDHGKSVFFTGSAGTGKSVLMREIIKRLRDKYRREPDRIAVTASTGLAACNIEGVTLHSFAGIGLGKESAPELVKKIKKNVKARTRWQRTKVLIIDEVSMVDGALFDKLEQVARTLRNNGRPFGGIQMVVTGDFFQLPPVPEKDGTSKFAFDASTWNTSIEHTILLTHVFRQRDPTFAGMLNEMRLGKLSQDSVNAFRKLSRPLQFEDSLEATELFPTRSEVDWANKTRMNMLSGETMTYAAEDSGVMTDIAARDRFLENCLAPKVIELKKGSQVMLIKNMEETLVNGSLGKVVAFMDESMFDYYGRHEEEFLEAQADDTSDEERMSQAKKNLRKALYKEGENSANRKKWPLVRFTLPDNTERTLLCMPEMWKTELPNGEIQAQRTQVPLILAWALSIHKAQGQTLERVKVDLGKVFEKGQAYVALSRATSQAGLQVTRFDARKVMVHPKVTDFYANMVKVEDVLKKNGNAKTKSAAANGSSATAAAAANNRKDSQPEFIDLVNSGCDDTDEEAQYMYGY